MSNSSGRVVIAGGTGFLGANLARFLIADGYEVVVLGRTRPSDVVGSFVQWDGFSLADWWRELEGCVALVNLAGRSVDCIKTVARQDEILRSRVESTQVLGKALRKLDRAPPVWVQMSTAHIYGDPAERVCDEDAAFGLGMAPIVGQAWEAAHEQALLPGMRSVVLRTSFVLGREGGALPRLAKVARCLLGGRIGSGRQGMSWIHEQDMNRLFACAIRDVRMQGAYLATAPHPVSNAVFMRELRRALRVPFGLPAANWMVRIGAPLFLHTDPELAIFGRYCASRRLAEEGFEFSFPELPAAMCDLLQKA
tara:strand:- start:26820 stop:27746 length:927 start_codon:yes stop_codon:yes gene_type:complete